MRTDSDKLRLLAEVLDKEHRDGQWEGCTDEVQQDLRRIADSLEDQRRYYDAKVVVGWPWFGLGRIRNYVDNRNWVTFWVVCLTNKLAIGIKLGGKKKA